LKHIKIFESFENEFNIDLITICEYTGNMYDAVEILIDLQNNSESHTINYCDVILKGEIKHRLYDSDDKIYFSKTMLGYKFLMKNTRYNAYFTFINVDVDDTISTLANTKKYNL